MTGLQILSKKIDITKLTREDFDTPELRGKYFRANNRSLDRLHLPEMTAEVYNPIAEEEFNNPKMDKANLKFETASEYYIKKARLFVLACDLGVKPNVLDSSSYIWNEDYYIHSNFLINVDIAEELYREEGEDEREASAYTVYIKQDPKGCAADTTLWNTLYRLCFKAITSRKAMLLGNIDKCLNTLQSIVEYTNGFSENVSSVQRATLEKYCAYYTTMLTNEEFKAFSSSNNDISVFADCEANRKDYIETYRSMLRSLVRCSGEELENLRDIMSTVEDPYIEYILAKDLDPEDFLSGGYLENEDGELEDTGSEE